MIAMMHATTPYNTNGGRDRANTDSHAHNGGDDGGDDDDGRQRRRRSADHRAHQRA